jgi:hypothetical protein
MAELQAGKQLPGIVAQDHQPVEEQLRNTPEQRRLLKGNCSARAAGLKLFK